MSTIRDSRVAHKAHSTRESGPTTGAFYPVVTAYSEKVVEFFLEREAAEAMIGEVREAEPELAEDLRAEAVELC